MRKQKRTHKRRKARQAHRDLPPLGSTDNTQRQQQRATAQYPGQAQKIPQDKEYWIATITDQYKEVDNPNKNDGAKKTL